MPPTIDRCELTHLARTPIDYTRAVEQHAAYETCLRDLGCDVRHLPPTPDLPDSVFVEDAAIVFDELAVIARPGALSRRAEIDSVTQALRPHRRLAFIEEPGTLDGGDVLVVGRHLFVGITARTNEAGARQLGAHASASGFQLTMVTVDGCLHLKSAVTAAREDLLVINPAWVDRATFSAFDVLDVEPSEPFAGNVLRVGETVVCASAHPLTRERLEARHVRTVAIPSDELAKAEGGLTCCALLLRC